jgi:hypothetical protein
VDFDGDGRLDLLSGSNCCDGAAFHLFRRKANGSWAPRERLEVTFPGSDQLLSYESVVTAADWNGDGVHDLLYGYGEGILVALGPFKGNGSIALTHQIDLSPKGKGYVSDFAVADWDRDGKPDLLVHHHRQYGKGGIYWYKNLGGLGLTQLAEGKLLVETTPDLPVRGFCVCDWNGDGWPDLIVTRDERVENREGKPLEWRGTVWLYLRE